MFLWGWTWRSNCCLPLTPQNYQREGTGLQSCRCPHFSFYSFSRWEFWWQKPFKLTSDLLLCPFSKHQQHFLPCCQNPLGLCCKTPAFPQHPQKNIHNFPSRASLEAAFFPTLLFKTQDEGGGDYKRLHLVPLDKFGCSKCLKNPNSPAWARTGLLHTSGKVLSRLVLAPWHNPFLPPAVEISSTFHPP